MSAKHTPTPWVKLTHQDVVALEGADGVRVARSSWHSTIRDPHPLQAEAIANFDLILLAVNSHAELVGALSACQWALQQAQEDLAAFEAGTRTKRSVSTSSAITAALSRIPDIQIKGAA
jgi:hypothetical protein